MASTDNNMNPDIPCQDIRQAQPWLRAFPDPAEVFSPEQPWLPHYFNALVSVDLGRIDPAWQGWLHLVSPIEPFDGYLGESGTHNAFTAPNWIGFRLDETGRYRFLGEREYFALDAPLVATHPFRIKREQEAREQLARYYQDQHAQFAASHERWLKNGILDWPHPDDPTRCKSEHDREHYPDIMHGRDPLECGQPLIEQLGGVTAYGNWSDTPEIPSAFVLDSNNSDNVFPRWQDGRPFRFIASTAGYPWRRHGADSILVFFEPQERTVLITFDWS
ncbi:MAG: hypothetical protein ABN482_07015 [Corticimicrobacter sp.]|uniref:hypothetical protein n=1 Tax=Corticimicrobacter sp. TaxID=2678536 RepID=UPI0032D9D591